MIVNELMIMKEAVKLILVMVVSLIGIVAVIDFTLIGTDLIRDIFRKVVKQWEL